MHKLVVQKLVMAGIVALCIAIFPMAAMAQATVFDEETRDIVVEIVQRVAGTLSPTVIGAPSAAAEEPVEEDVEAMPVPQNEEAAPEPGTDVTELPELNLTDLAEYSSQGVSILVPADWIVETDVDDSTPFFIEVPGTNLIISLSSDSELDFPSWLGVALFRSQGELFASELGEDGTIEESATLYTEQNLPVAKLAYSGSDSGETFGGAFYTLAPNDDAYTLLVVGTPEEWEYANPGVDLIAQSILFDDDLLDVQWAEGEPFDFTDMDGTVQVTVPISWYAMSTGDPQFPIILAEPEARYVAAIGTEDAFGEDFDATALDEFFSDEGVVDPADYENLIATVAEMISSSGSPITLDDELSQVIPREGATTVRLVGTADMGDGLEMPVILYVDMRDSGIVVVTVFGDTENAVAQEEEIQAMVESVEGL